MDSKNQNLSDNSRAQYLQNFKLILQHWKTIIINFFIVAILAIAISLMLPKIYRSNATLMPPSQQQGLGMLQAMSNIQIPGLSLFSGGDEETNTLIAILSSRRVMENVVDSLNLIKVYGVENMEKAVRALRANSYFDETEEGTINITADASTDWLSEEEEEDSARLLAKNIVHYFVVEVDRINKELRNQKAHYQREFIEKRYHQNVKDMKQAELSLKNFQEEYGVIQINDQTQAAIQSAADLKTQLITSKIELQVKSKFLNQNNPEVRMLKEQVQELQQQFSDLKYASPDSAAIFPSFSDVPELGMKFLQLKREVEIQNEIYKFLTQQYEQAKIEEARNTPTVQILDSAYYPIRKYKPKRMIMVVFYSFFSVILTVLYILTKPTLKEIYQEMKK